MRLAGVVARARSRPRCPAPLRRHAGAARSCACARSRRGFDSPVYVTAPRSEPGKLYVVEQPGVIRVLVERQAPRAAVPRHPHRSSGRGGEQGLLSVAFHPNYAQNHRFYVDYTDTERRHARRRVPLERRRRRCRARRGRCCSSSTSRTPNHNGGQLAVRPGRAALRRASATAARGGDPQQPRAEPRASRLGKLLRTERRQARRALAGRRLRPAQPVALLVRPRDRRPLHRRRRPGRTGRRSTCARRAQRRGATTTAGASTRAARATQRRPAGRTARRARLPGRRLHPRGRAARSPAATSTAARPCQLGSRPLLLRRLLQRHDLEPAHRRAASCAERRARAVQGLEPLVVRRGRGRRALRDLARRHDLQARR